MASVSRLGYCVKATLRVGVTGSNSIGSSERPNLQIESSPALLRGMFVRRCIGWLD